MFIVSHLLARNRRRRVCTGATVRLRHSLACFACHCLCALLRSSALSASERGADDTHAGTQGARVSYDDGPERISAVVLSAYENASRALLTLLLKVGVGCHVALNERVSA